MLQLPEDFLSSFSPPFLLLPSLPTSSTSHRPRNMLQLATSFVALLACLLPSAIVLAAPSYSFAPSLVVARQDAPLNSTDASPAPSTAYTADVPLHSSCNATQSMQILAGFEEMKTLARTGIEHILHNGRDDFFKLYFGEDGDPAPVVGVLQTVVDVSLCQIPDPLRILLMKTLSGQQSRHVDPMRRPRQPMLPRRLGRILAHQRHRRDKHLRPLLLHPQVAGYYLRLRVHRRRKP